MDILPDKSVGVIEEDVERNIVKICKPIGVIGALSPSTNPEATPVIKAINAVKGRNAIIIAPHPRAKFINMTIVNKMRDALVKMGAPADLVQTMAQPSLGKTEELMKQCDFILATWRSRDGQGCLFEWNASTGRRCRQSQSSLLTRLQI